MNLPNIISELLKAQNKFDSGAYANCFTEDAEVVDEGKKHKGQIEIQNWIDKANKEYGATMTPLDFNEGESILSVETAGAFPGSPVVLKYHFQLFNDRIKYLKITT
ncbi:nuclear transport factor 2 family protein [Sphingobacterium multivorum]|uniref:nuclear transport factor 2 family protein n=1 Tax=Sphingobacterium multivorum TaxID=28454 RepID=UPI0031BADCA2